MLAYIRRIKREQSLALSDAITGLLNSEGLRRAAAKHLNSSTPHYAIVVMELKNWCQIVHTFGGAKSNQVLVHIARTLRASLSASECAARLSGGTMCFLIKNRQEDAVLARLLRIYESANQFNLQRKIPYTLDLVFGAYLPVDSSESFNDIQEKAQQMLLLDKNSPRVRFYHNNPIDEKAVHRWELIEQMDRSLASGDFLVYMQPKVRLGDNRIVGAEALVRWRHPRRGLLTPEMFIPLLEEYHLIHRFDLYLFEVVCRKMAEWKQMGLSPCPISVNLSLETLDHDHFLEPYTRLVQKYRLAPEYLEFELSEPILFEKPQKLRALLDEIHSYGFKCSLDHFGESAIPLQLLRELSIDTLKLDRSFFTSENNSRANRYIVEAILKITSQLQIYTVAEGIDNASQVQYLRQSGCDMIQGFYYFRPMPVDEFQKTAFADGQLRYVEVKENQNGRAGELAAHSTGSSSIIMFTFLFTQDRVVFSDTFSPLLYGQLSVSEAAALFSHSDLIHENDRRDFVDLLERCRKNEGWVEDTLRFYTNEARYEWLEVHMHREHIASGGEDVISGTLVNTARWKNEVTRWMEKANRDSLTGLYNRHYFKQFVSTTLENGAPANSAIIFFDLDHFKQVNDTLGHMVGDDVLCFISKHLLGTFRHTDVVARYAGDEFIIFVSDLDRVDLEKRLEELCSVLQTPYRAENIDYPLSGSIGVAVYPNDGETYEDLLYHADTAAYVAKEQGRAQFVFYHPSMESMAELKK